jgi:TatD DNase family protein
MHCFLGDRALADEFLELGFHLGIGGSITFEKNDALRKVVKQLPLDRILLETDCPYLAPVPYRGKRNEPRYVRYVADTIAEVKQISVEAVAEATTENAATLFNLW